MPISEWITSVAWYWPTGMVVVPLIIGLLAGRWSKKGIAVKVKTEGIAKQLARLGDIMEKQA